MQSVLYRTRIVEMDEGIPVAAAATAAAVAALTALAAAVTDGAEDAKSDTASNTALAKISREGGPVTCVSLPSDELLLFGRGPFLERHSTFFSRKQGEENDNHRHHHCHRGQERHLVFPAGGIIHGIRYPPQASSFSLLFGGKQVTFLKNALQQEEPIRCLAVQHNDSSSSSCSLRPDKVDQPQTTQLELTDWIWDIQFISPKNANNETKIRDVTTTTTTTTAWTVVVGLAHHILEVWRVEYIFASELVQVTRQTRIVANPACLVTSMHLFPCPTSHDLWVAAGTAFREILVWKAKLSYLTRNQEIIDVDAIATPQLQDPASISYLRAHSGVVHSVQFSSEGTTLVSTSDDRTVRMWQKQQEPNNANSNPTWSLAWTGWGHTARVWSATFAPVLGVVVSAGEDHCLRVWSHAEGRLLAVLESSSASVWSVDRYNSLILGGGNNGTVMLDDLSSRLRPADSEGGRLQQETFLIPDDRIMRDEPIVVEMIPAENKKPDEEQSQGSVTAVVLESGETNVAPKKKKLKKHPAQVIVGVKWYNVAPDQSPKLLVGTRNGSLMSLDPRNEQWTQLGSWWNPLLLTKTGIDCTDGCCMALHPNDDCVAIGTTRGDVVVVAGIHGGLRRIILSSARDQKSVQGLKWVNPTTLLSFHVRTSTLWSFQDDPTIALDEECIRRVTLSMGSKAVPMSFAIDSENDNVIIGDSRGGIALFHTVNEKLVSANGPSSTLEPAGMLNFVHQKEHVTGLQLHSSKIISVGNDGCLHVSYIEGSSLRKGFSLPVGSLSGISDLWSIHRSNGGSSNTFVGGYHGNTFVVVDTDSGYELFRRDTGGRQRSKDFFIDLSFEAQSSSRQHGLVVCSSRKDGRNELMLDYLTSCTYPKIRSPRELQFSKGVTLHNETLFSINLFTLRGQLVLLTGSEDCSARISVCCPGLGEGLLSSISLTPQESCVRAVCSSQRDDSSALVVVGGGKLVVQFFLVREKREGCKPVTTGLSELEVSFLGNGRINLNAGIDHRINAVKAIPLDGQPGIHLVVAGDSNGNCHFYVVSENQASRPVHGYLQSVGSRPVLSVDVLKMRSRLLLIFGTTGGDVFLWDVPSTVDGFPVNEEGLDKTGSFQPRHFGEYQAHQMGTNAIGATALRSWEEDGEFYTTVLICSGGDDQAIYICEARISQSDVGVLKLRQPFCQHVTREASSSAIKGIIHLPRGNNDNIATFLSVGYSQRLAKWQYSSCEPKSLILLNQCPVDVGDVNCMDASRGVVAVGGFGVELFSVFS
jgi:WD40 repeat protein